MPRTPAWALLAAVTLTGLAGCSRGDARSEGGARLRAVTTVAPLTSIAANIGGARVDLRGLVPEGTNSHTFEPPPSVAEAVSDADVVFANGLKLEDPTIELAAANLRSGAKVVELGTAVLPPADWIYDFSFPKRDGKPNPHLWTNPRHAIRYAAVIRDTYTALDPDGRDYYAQNYAAFTRKADALAAAMRTATATVPAHNRVLLTYHDGYAYFARDFGYRVIGAIQPSNFEDPTPREVADLIDQVRAMRVPAIFGSEVFPSKTLEEIGRETGARYIDVLRDDDLPGAPGEREHSWLGLMRFDYVTIVRALGGDPSALDALDTSDVAPDRARYPQ